MENHTDKTFLIGLLGPPGSGKGTQCHWLARTFDLEHISICTILRAKMDRPGSASAAIIRQNMTNGTAGPKELTVGIIKSHITQSLEAGQRVFILDGT